MTKEEEIQSVRATAFASYYAGRICDRLDGGMDTPEDLKVDVAKESLGIADDAARLYEQLRKVE